jgi:hypothetical protein
VRLSISCLSVLPSAVNKRVGCPMRNNQVIYAIVWAAGIRLNLFLLSRIADRKGPP